MKQPLSTLLQPLPPLLLSTLPISFLPNGMRIRKPESMPTLMRIMTTPKSRAEAEAIMSAVEV